MKSSSTDPQNNALGDVLAHYPINNQGLKRWLFLILGGVSILASIGLTSVLVIKLTDKIRIHGRAMILSITSFPTALYGGLFLIGILGLSLAVIFWKDGVTLFTTGLLICKRRRERIWIYNDMSRFDSHIWRINFGGSALSLGVTIILEDMHQQRLIIQNRYKNMLELVTCLRGLVLPELIKKCRYHLKLGGSLYFHRLLQIDSRGIIIKGHTLPANRIAFKIQNKVIILYEKNNLEKSLLKIKSLQINNFDVLIDILENPPKEQCHASSK